MRLTPRPTRRSARWLVPIAVVGGTAAAVAIPSLLPAGADPVPVLPALTAAELLQKVQQADVTALSGTVETDIDLGLPDLGGFADSSAAPATVLDVLSGRHTARVAIDGPDRQRIAMEGEQSETHWIHDGDELWSWNSTADQVRHLDLGGWHGGDEQGDAGDEAVPAGDLPAVVPGEAVEDLLDSAAESTEISVRTPGYVAGRPVYELVLEPKEAASTVGAVVVDVDATTGLPLEVRLESSDGGDPIGRIGFTSISYDTPDPATFAFTPPPGAQVLEADDLASMLPFGAGLFGMPERALGGDPGATDRSGERPAGGGDGAADPGGPGAEPAAEATSTVVGHDWSTMLVVSGVDLPPMVASLLSDGPTVDTPAGPAQLIGTRLVNVLLLPDGRIAVAALDPGAMVAALPA